MGRIGLYTSSLANIIRSAVESSPATCFGQKGRLLPGMQVEDIIINGLMQVKYALFCERLVQHVDVGSARAASARSDRKERYS